MTTFTALIFCFFLRPSPQIPVAARIEKPAMCEVPSSVRRQGRNRRK